MAEPVSIVGVTMTAYGAVLRRGGVLVARTIVPGVLSFAALYLFLTLFLEQLADFLQAPNLRIASLGLGALAAGFFIVLFLHCVISLAVVETTQDRDGRLWPLLRAGRAEWRLYAAFLRLIGILVLGIGGAVWVFRAVMDPRSFYVVALAYLVATLGAAFAALRVGFPMVPVALLEHGPIVRRAFALSREHFVAVFAIAISALVPALVIFFAGRYAVSALGLLPYLRHGASPLDQVHYLRAALPEFLGILFATYYAATVMLSAASAVFYRRRVTRAPGG